MMPHALVMRKSARNRTTLSNQGKSTLIKPHSLIMENSTRVKPHSVIMENSTRIKPHSLIMESQL
jgi:hypothetical protein